MNSVSFAFSSYTVTASSWIACQRDRQLGLQPILWQQCHLAQRRQPHDPLEVMTTDYATLYDGTGSGNLSNMTTVYFTIDFTTPTAAITLPLNQQLRDQPSARLPEPRG